MPGWLSGLGAKIALAAAFIGLLLLAVLKLIGIGRKVERGEANARIVHNVETRHEVDRDVARVPDPADELRGKWSRD